VPRQPQARAGRLVAVIRGRGQPPRERRLFTDEDHLDVDTLHLLVEDAEAVSEGRIYASAKSVGAGGGADEAGGAVFLGTTLLTIDLAMATMLTDKVDPNLARRLRIALTEDVRAQRVVGDRVYREVARLLGPLTPAALELNRFVRCQGLRVLVDVDIEAPVTSVAAR
jgi:hypothetical protein